MSLSFQFILINIPKNMDNTGMAVSLSETIHEKRHRYNLAGGLQTGTTPDSAGLCQSGGRCGAGKTYLIEQAAVGADFHSCQQQDVILLLVDKGQIRMYVAVPIALEIS